jgi:hypothetical protein
MIGVIVEYRKALEAMCVCESEDCVSLYVCYIAVAKLGNHQIT